MKKYIAAAAAFAIGFSVIIAGALAQGVPPTPPTPIIVQVPSAGVIDYGQAFGWAQPYVISVASALVAAIAGWIVFLIQRFLGFSIDKKLSDGYITNAQNQAAELIAKGFVKIKENGRVEIVNTQLAAAANDLIKSVPDAVSHFDLKPTEIANKIIAMVPQVPAVATAIAAAAAADKPPTSPPPSSSFRGEEGRR